MDKKHLSIVGANTKGSREDNDFYPTPYYATEELFKKEEFEGGVWECASGDGSMSKIIEKYNKCVSTELRTCEGVYGEKGIDFLKTLKKSENIITNPPFKYAKDFLLHSKKCATKKIAMLLKLVFLEGQSRYDMFKDKTFPLKKVYVFCGRVPIYKKGIIGKNSGLIAYAWFVWDKKYKGNPEIDWINAKPKKGGNGIPPTNLFVGILPKIL